MNKLQKICSKCDQPYHQHVQTGAGEWICPSKENMFEKDKISYSEVISGAIYDCLSDWVSSYKINEDLPHIAEMMAREILDNLKQFKLKIVEESKIES